MTMPRDPQGAGTRVETKVEWRNVYADGKTGIHYADRWMCDLPAHAKNRKAIERIETTTTITREPIPPHAGEETKG